MELTKQVSKKLGKIYPFGSGAWKAWSGEAASPEAEIYTEVQRRDGLETLLGGTVPPAGGLVHIFADGTSYSYVIDVSLRVQVRKLYDLNVQALSFTAQLTVSLEWIVDEGLYEAHEAFWDAYRPALWLPASSRNGNIMAGVVAKSSVRQYRKASDEKRSQRMRHFALELTDTFTFKQAFDLRNFPFDIQSLCVRFESPAVEVWGRPFGTRLRPGQEKGAKFPTLEARISVDFHSFWLIFGRVIISRNGLEASMVFLERARAEQPR